MPVLVVGAGPTGLTLACELARRRIACRIIDKSSGPSIHSKALGVQARTLELLERLDISESICRCGRKIRGGNLYSRGERILQFRIEGIDSPYDFIVSFPQSETERLLIEKLSTLGVEVEWGVELSSLDQQQQGVTAQLRSNGTTELMETVSVDWLVGCDGAHSTVRHALNSPFVGARFEESFYLADLRAEFELDQNEVHVFLSEEGPFLFLPLPQENCYRVIVSEPPGKTEIRENPTLEDFQRWMERRVTLPRGVSVPELANPVWVSHFRVHRRLVPRYRHGRVFLAGDAGHIHSPVGGQGMNTSIQDAINLAWKLALVCQGKAHDSLLDSYEAERRPVAEAVLQGTDVMTRMVTLHNPMLQSIRNFAASSVMMLPSARRGMLRNMTELAIGYPKSPIVMDNGPSLWRNSGAWWAFRSGPKPGDRAPDGELLNTNSQEKDRLFDVFRDPRSTLLLFTGRKPNEESRKRLVAVAEYANSQWDEIAQVCVIDPELDTDWPKGSLVWTDTGAKTHDKYGAMLSCVYAIRPDGYVGYRSSPIDLDNLKLYFARYLCSAIADSI